MQYFFPVDIGIWYCIQRQDRYWPQPKSLATFSHASSLGSVAVLRDNKQWHYVRPLGYRGSVPPPLRSSYQTLYIPRGGGGGGGGGWQGISQDGVGCQGISQDPSSLSFGRVVSWKPPYWTGKNFFEELPIMTFVRPCNNQIFYDMAEV